MPKWSVIQFQKEKFLIAVWCLWDQVATNVVVFPLINQSLSNSIFFDEILYTSCFSEYGKAKVALSQIYKTFRKLKVVCWNQIKSQSKQTGQVVSSMKHY